MKELEGRVAVVTGASKGIGAAIAQALGAAGAAVVVNYASARDGADRVVAEIERGGGRARAVQADVSKPLEVDRLFEETVRVFGGVDVLVNNAGIFKFEPVEAVTPDEFRRHFETNVLGPFLTIQEALKRFPARGGSIVNISSGSSTHPSAGSSLYAATKGALDTLTMALANELGPRNIRVNTVAPGGTETEGAHRIGFMGSAAERAMIAATPLGRLGQPSDIAPVVVFLASDAAAWVTGERISASGGLG
jgi:3-oxoacyl-[acyl-carrier protein] reductase